MTGLSDSGLGENNEDRPAALADYSPMTALKRGSLGEQRFTTLGSISPRVPHEKISQTCPNRHATFQITPPLSSKTFVLYSSSSEEDVSEEFVKLCNEHIGNWENLAKAKRLLQKMRELGGLEPTTSDQPLDIPAARMGLAILAGLKNHTLKIQALESLQQLLVKEDLSKENSIDLVSLAIKLMKHMDRELIQTEIIDTQIAIATAYGKVAELIQRHYAKRHINAITKDLKIQLSQTTQTLECLNRQEEAPLTFSTEFALEGIKRLKDDKKTLFDVLERLIHGSISILAVCKGDLDVFLSEIKKSFSQLNLSSKNSWYDALLLVDEFARKSNSNIVYLMAIQSLTAQTCRELDWKFLYGTLRILSDSVIHGETKEIRQCAFSGQKTSTHYLPGLVTFQKCEIFASKPDLSPLTQLESPRWSNENGLIRRAVAEHLFKISKEAPDAEIRLQAKLTLLVRLDKETDAAIKRYISDQIPFHPEEIEAWKTEQGPYAYAPPKPTSYIENRIETAGRSSLLNLPTAAPHSPSAPHGISGDIFMDGFTKDTPRAPNKTARQLSICLGVAPEFISNKIKYKGDIRPWGEEGLAITEKGMKQITTLITTYHEISRIDLTICQDRVEGIEALAEAIRLSRVNFLKISATITPEAAQSLADAMEANRNLQVELEGGLSNYYLGKALSKLGLTQESLNVLNKGIAEEEASENKKDKILAELYYKRGLTHILNGDAAKAKEDFLRVFTFDPAHFKACLELSKVYLEVKNYPEAKIFADRALEIRPEDPKAQVQKRRSEMTHRRTHSE